MITRNDCIARDAADPLAPLRAHFTLPDGVVYLNGNSLGVLPNAALQRAQDEIRREWGDGLVRSWNQAGWFDLPIRLGNKIAPLIGAHQNEVAVTDSTSINLFKVRGFSATSRSHLTSNVVLFPERFSLRSEL